MNNLPPLPRPTASLPTHWFKLNIYLYSGEVFGILCQKNGGKTQLATALASGTAANVKVWLQGSPLNLQALSLATLMPVRKSIALVPQNAAQALIPTVKVRKSALHIMSALMPEHSRDQLLARLCGRLEQLGVNPQRCLDQYPRQLTALQRSLVVLTLSTMLNPEVLVVDEALAELSKNGQNDFWAVVQRILDKRICKSVIYLSANPQTIKEVSQRLGVLLAGEIVELGSTHSLLSDPKHPYTQDYLAAGGDLVLPLVRESHGCAYSEYCSSVKNDCKMTKPLPRTVINRDVNCMYAK